MVFGIHLELLFENEWYFNHLSVTKYAVKLLVDLRDLSKETGKEKTFKRKLVTLSQAHYRKVTFMSRLQKAGLNN